MESKRLDVEKIGIFAAGGTGGHIIPAIAIATELKKMGITIIFVGNKGGMEEKLVKNAGIDFVGIDVQKLYRKLTLKHILFPYKLIKSVMDSIKIINLYQPDFFVGTGGFVSGPVGIAAKMKKIPLFIQEQNSFPGLTNRKLGKFAKLIFLGYDSAKRYFPADKTVFSGNPINPIDTDEKIDFAKYNLTENSKKIFLLGGSQGSRFMNGFLDKIVDRLLKKSYEIIWQTGKWDIEFYQKKYNNKKGLYLFDFSSEIGKIYNSVDMVISRAGAISLEEIKFKKLPSVLIPLSIAAGNHQYFNALEMKKAGISSYIKESDMTAEKLFDAIESTMQKRDEIMENFKNITMRKSASVIAENILRNL